MNKKGQALVEFILVLPVIIVLVVTVFDYVKIIENKVMLDNYLNEVIENNEYELPKNIDLIKEENTYYISTDIEINSLVMQSIYDKKYHLTLKRTVS